MSETPAQRMFREIQEMRDAFPNGFGLLDGVKADLAKKDATIAALRIQIGEWIQRLDAAEAKISAARELAASEPMIVSGIREDLRRSPNGRGGSLHHQPETAGYGAGGCPGDNVIEWFDSLREALGHD